MPEEVSLQHLKLGHLPSQIRLPHTGTTADFTGVGGTPSPGVATAKASASHFDFEPVATWARTGRAAMHLCRNWQRGSHKSPAQPDAVQSPFRPWPPLAGRFLARQR